MGLNSSPAAYVEELSNGRQIVIFFMEGDNDNFVLR